MNVYQEFAQIDTGLFRSVFIFITKVIVPLYYFIQDFCQVAVIQGCRMLEAGELPVPQVHAQSEQQA